jgi:hypothetical protein
MGYFTLRRPEGPSRRVSWAFSTACYVINAFTPPRPIPACGLAGSSDLAAEPRNVAEATEAAVQAYRFGFFP